MSELLIEFPISSCAKVASASSEDGGIGGIGLKTLERSSPGAESGEVAIDPEFSNAAARVLVLVWEEVIPVHSRVLRVVALTFTRVMNEPLVNSQAIFLDVHFWHGYFKLHFTLALAHASQDLRRDRLR